MRRPKFQYSIRTLLIVLTIVAVSFSLYLKQRIGPDEILICDTEDENFLWHRGHAVRVRLDLDLLRMQGLTRDDVIRAMTPSGFYDHPKQPPLSSGVVIELAHARLEQYEAIILRATPRGEIVRLKDVGKAEIAW